MLAGYLPFDDDPANPEGDNINLLYKYIVATPLTFPEYVTPHARDLLRRILVPDPRKRADLFEVARHSWLSEFHHVVGFITSSSTTHGDIGTTTVGSEEQEAPLLNRSASVREPSKTAKSPPAVGDLARKHGGVDGDAAEAQSKSSKDNKRRTVQVEYVAPKSQTVRGEPSASTAPKTRARSGSQGPVEVSSQEQQGSARRVISKEKPLPRDPPGAYSQRPSSSQRQQNMPPPSRPGRDIRSTSEANYASSGPPVSMVGRPNTGNSMTSGRTGALVNRGSYSQPAPATVAGTNAQGRIAQPKSYDTAQDELEYPRISANQIPPKFAKVAGFPLEDVAPGSKGHKRSSTIGGFFSRTGSVFGGKRDKDEKTKKSYPPVSMSGAVGTGAGSDTPRQSMDSRRSISFGFNKKRSGSITGGSQTTTLQEKPRRFSLIPASFSLKAIGIGKEYGTPGNPPADYDDRPDSQGNYPDAPNTNFSQARNVSGSTASEQRPYASDGAYDHNQDSSAADRRATSTSSPPTAQRYASSSTNDPRSGAAQPFFPTMRADPSAITTESETSINEMTNRRGEVYPAAPDRYEAGRRPPVGRQYSSGKGVLQKPQRKFTDAYEQDQSNGWNNTPHNDHAGSSGAARKVMDFFRRRGKDRSA
jgi:protein-serine/threonine kinase